MWGRGPAAVCCGCGARTQRPGTRAALHLQEESAQGKNKALRDAGAIVPDSFEGFEGAIRWAWGRQRGRPATRARGRGGDRACPCRLLWPPWVMQQLHAAHAASRRCRRRPAGKRMASWWRRARSSPPPTLRCPASRSTWRPPPSRARCARSPLPPPFTRLWHIPPPPPQFVAPPSPLPSTRSRHPAALPPTTPARQPMRCCTLRLPPGPS